MCRPSSSRWLGVLVSALWGLCGVVVVQGYGTGAPLEQCDGMMPSHYGAQITSALTASTPFNITADRYVLEDSDPPSVTVTLAAKQSPPTFFRGFMLQARDDNDVRVGTFSLPAQTNSQLLACGGVESTAVTHTTNISGPGTTGRVEVLWTAPANLTGNVTFVATVAEYQMTVYTDLRSEPVVWRRSESGARLSSSSGLCWLAVVCAFSVAWRLVVL